MRNSEVLCAIHAWVRKELNQYALVVRQLAYSLPDGAGEWELLQLSDQLRMTASDDLRKLFASLGLNDPLTPQHRNTAPEDHTIEEIRAVIPQWPDTMGIPWQMCAMCHLVYDPTACRRQGHACQ